MGRIATLFLIVSVLCLGTVVPASADPITLLVSAVATFSASVSGTLIAGSFLIHFGVTAALGIATSLLGQSAQGEPKDQGYQVNTRGGAQPHAVIYGETVVGGPVIFDEVTDDYKFLHRVIAIAGHECEEVTEVYLDDVKLEFDGGGTVIGPGRYMVNGSPAVRVKIHLGDQTTADSGLVSASNGKWTSSHIGKGICYAYVRFKFKRKAYPNGVPTVTFKVKGKKVFDPRSSATVYSDNAALCVRDYYISEHGMEVNASDIDDTDTIASANICDENVALSAGGTEKRYTINGSFTVNSTHRPIVTALHAAMAGYPVYSQGQWGSVVGVYTAPSKTLTMDDLRSNISLSPRHPRSQNFNGVTGLFREAKKKFHETSYPPVQSAVFLAEDNGVENSTELDLPFTSTNTGCQRIAKIALYRHRQQKSWSSSFGLNAFEIAVGEIVEFDYDRWGWSAKEFECVAWKLRLTSEGEPLIDLAVHETSAGVFDWDAEESEFLADDTDLPDPFIASLASISLSTELRNINQKVSGVLVIDVAASTSGYVDYFAVSAKKSADSVWISLGTSDDGRFEMLDVADEDYDVRVRTFNTFGVESDYTYRLNYPVTVFGDPPDDVSNFNITVVAGMANFTWDAVSNLDLSHYIIKHSPAETGAEWGAATKVSPKIARPATSIALPYRSGTYFIQSVDKLGIGSVSPTQVSTTVAEIEGLNVVADLTESTGFAGIHDNLTLSSGAIELTQRYTRDFGTYDFENYIDLTEKYTVRITGAVEFIRDDDRIGAELFDDDEELFDSGSGLFDGPIYDDVDIVHKVAVTDGDPNHGLGSIDNIYEFGDTFSTSDFIRTVDICIELDLEFTEGDTGIILDMGNVANAGISVYIDESDNVIFRAGDGASGIPMGAAVGSFALSQVNNSKGLLIIAVDISTDSIEAFWAENGSVWVSLGSATASGGLSNSRWGASGLGCKFGAQNGTTPGDPVTGADFSGVARSMKVYDNIAAPVISALAVWSDWLPFTTGDFSGRAFKLRTYLTTETNGVSPKVSALTVNVDMPDRVITEADVDSGAGAKAIVFSPAFKESPGIGIGAQGMVSGDYYEITAKSSTGFTIHFKNSGGSSVDRTFDYIARGYGKAV